MWRSLLLTLVQYLINTVSGTGEWARCEGEGSPFTPISFLLLSLSFLPFFHISSTFVVLSLPNYSTAESNLPHSYTWMIPSFLTPWNTIFLFHVFGFQCNRVFLLYWMLRQDCYASRYHVVVLRNEKYTNRLHRVVNFNNITRVYVGDEWTVDRGPCVAIQLTFLWTVTGSLPTDSIENHSDRIFFKTADYLNNITNIHKEFFLPLFFGFW